MSFREASLTRYVVRFVFIIAATGLLGGCGGLQPPINAAGATAQSRPIAALAERARSWMLPEAKREDLLYVSNFREGNVLIYNYKTGAAVGKLRGFDGPSGQCVDKNGNIWIINYYGESVVEYSHGGTTRLKTFATDGMALGCAVSPSGDLAVDNYYRGGNPSNIEIFKNASGEGEDFENPTDCFVLNPPAYDEKGNLYVQPSVITSNSWVCELPAKGNALEKVSLRGHVDDADNAIWDGTHIALVDAGYNGDYDTAIYQTKRLASGGLSVTGTTALPDACHGSNSEVNFPFVVGKKNTPINHEQGTVVIGSNIGCRPYSLEYWRYPQGGEPFKTIPLKFQAGGQSVSLANH